MNHEILAKPWNFMFKTKNAIISGQMYLKTNIYLYLFLTARNCSRGPSFDCKASSALFIATNMASLVILIRKFQKFAIYEFDLLSLSFRPMKLFFSKFMDSTLHFSKIRSFCGTHGTHANYALLSTYVVQSYLGSEER